MGDFSTRLVTKHISDIRVTGQFTGAIKVAMANGSYGRSANSLQHGTWAKMNKEMFEKFAMSLIEAYEANSPIPVPSRFQYSDTLVNGQKLLVPSSYVNAKDFFDSTEMWKEMQNYLGAKGIDINVTMGRNPATKKMEVTEGLSREKIYEFIKAISALELQNMDPTRVYAPASNHVNGIRLAIECGAETFESFRKLEPYSTTIDGKQVKVKNPDYRYKGFAGWDDVTAMLSPINDAWFGLPYSDFEKLIISNKAIQLTTEELPSLRAPNIKGLFATHEDPHVEPNLLLKRSTEHYNTLSATAATIPVGPN